MPVGRRGIRPGLSLEIDTANHSRLILFFKSCNDSSFKVKFVLRAWWKRPLWHGLRLDFQTNFFYFSPIPGANIPIRYTTLTHVTIFRVSLAFYLSFL